MDDKGQITVEAILIFGVLTLLFIGISFPAMLDVYTHSSDTTRVLEMRENLDTIATAIDHVRKGGPGTVKTVGITVNENNWTIASGNSSASPPYDGILYYLVRWNNVTDVPDHLIQLGSFGGLAVEAFDGINNPPVNQVCPPLPFDKGPGTYHIRIENQMTAINSTNPYIEIDCSQINQNRILVNIV